MKTKKAKTSNSTLKKRAAAICFLFCLLTGFFAPELIRAKPKRTEKVAGVSAVAPAPTPPVSKVKPSTRKGWELYANPKYNFSLEVPVTSTVMAENKNTGVTQHTRVQNDAKSETPGLARGEYVVEANIYDTKVKQPSKCEENPKGAQFITVSGVRGAITKKEPTDTAKVVYQLCLTREGVTYNVYASEDIELNARTILRSFKFVN